MSNRAASCKKKNGRAKVAKGAVDSTQTLMFQFITRQAHAEEMRRAKKIDAKDDIGKRRPTPEDSLSQSTTPSGSPQESKGDPCASAALSVPVQLKRVVSFLKMQPSSVPIADIERATGVPVANNEALERELASNSRVQLCKGGYQYTTEAFRMRSQEDLEALIADEQTISIGKLLEFPYENPRPEHATRPVDQIVVERGLFTDVLQVVERAGVLIDRRQLVTDSSDEREYAARIASTRVSFAFHAKYVTPEEIVAIRRRCAAVVGNHGVQSVVAFQQRDENEFRVVIQAASNKLATRLFEAELFEAAQRKEWINHAPKHAPGTEADRAEAVLHAIQNPRLFLHPMPFRRLEALERQIASFATPDGNPTRTCLNLVDALRRAKKRAQHYAVHPRPTTPLLRVCADVHSAFARAGEETQHLTPEQVCEELRKRGIPLMRVAERPPLQPMQPPQRRRVRVRNRSKQANQHMVARELAKERAAEKENAAGTGKRRTPEAAAAAEPTGVPKRIRRQRR